MTTTDLKASVLSLASRIKIEPFPVDGIDGLHIKGMTGRERDSFESACFVQRGKERVLQTENIRAKLLVRTLCDGTGARLFTDRDESELGALPASILDEMFAIAQRLSGIGAAEVKELEGN